MEYPPKERQVTRLADGDGAEEKAGGENECNEQTAEIGGRFVALAKVGPEAAENDEEIAGPGGHGNHLIGMLEMAAGDGCMKPMQAIAKESSYEKIDVIPQGASRKADEVAPAVAAKS